MSSHASKAPRDYVITIKLDDRKDAYKQGGSEAIMRNGEWFYIETLITVSTLKIISRVDADVILFPQGHPYVDGSCGGGGW